MKRINSMLLLVLAAAFGLFGLYHLWVHNRLDETGPVITVDEGILELSVADGDEALLQGVTALDDRDGDVTDSVLVESVTGVSQEGLTTVVYAAFDRAGNVSKLSRQIRYSDYVSPRFSLEQALSFPYGHTFNVLDEIGAEDVLEGDIRRRIRATLVSDTRSVSEMGTHTVRFQVTNALGDTSEVDLPVVVYDPQWFNASVELDDYLIYVSVGQSVNLKEYLKSFVIRGDEIDLSRGIPADIQCDISGELNTNVPGVYTISYELSKNVYMDTFTGQTRLTVIVTD